MRDIKFRAWDNLEKRMRKVVSLYWQDDKLVSAKLEGENTERFLRKPSECLKVTDRRECSR